VLELNASDLSLVGAWAVPPAQQNSDSDFGATPTLFNGVIGGQSVPLVGVINKNGIFYAFDDRTGKVVWTANVGLATGSAPVMYEVKGTEYIAIVLGGSAVTGAQNLGKLGAAVLVLKLGGAPIKPLPAAGN